MSVYQWKGQFLIIAIFITPISEITAKNKQTNKTNKQKKQQQTKQKQNKRKQTKQKCWMQNFRFLIFVKIVKENTQYAKVCSDPKTQYGCSFTVKGAWWHVVVIIRANLLQNIWNGQF